MFITLNIKENIKRNIQQGKKIVISVEDGNVVFKDEEGNLIPNDVLKKIFIFL